jgi:hypothetical protein
MTHNEKIVEAVARAIANHIHKDADFGMDGTSAYAARPWEFQSIARAAITAYQAEAWQPIETAPKGGDEIDLWAGGERLANCWWGRATYGGRERTWVRHAYDDCNGPVFNEVRKPTHWQPLPNPPASP